MFDPICMALCDGGGGTAVIDITKYGLKKMSEYVALALQNGGTYTDESLSSYAGVWAAAEQAVKSNSAIYLYDGHNRILVGACDDVPVMMCTVPAFLSDNRVGFIKVQAMMYRGYQETTYTIFKTMAEVV